MYTRHKRTFTAFKLFCYLYEGRFLHRLTVYFRSHISPVSPLLCLECLKLRTGCKSSASRLDSDSNSSIQRSEASLVKLSCLLTTWRFSSKLRSKKFCFVCGGKSDLGQTLTSMNETPDENFKSLFCYKSRILEHFLEISVVYSKA